MTQLENLEKFHCSYWNWKFQLLHNISMHVGLSARKCVGLIIS